MVLAGCAVLVAVLGVWLHSLDDPPLGGLTGLGTLALAAALLVGAVALPTVRQVEFGFPVGVRVVTATRTREEELRAAFEGQQADLDLYAHLMCDDPVVSANLLEAAWADAARNWRGSTASPALRIYVLCVLVQLMRAQLRWGQPAADPSEQRSPLASLAAEDRLVLVLHEFARLPRAQIAELMEISPTEIEVRLRNVGAFPAEPPLAGGRAP